MKEVSFLQGLHTKTKRDYFARMNAEKPECMRVAKQYGFDYWDGDRKYGYGGYVYDGRWKPIAEAMVKYYELKPDDKVFDIGCGKGALLRKFYEIGMQYFGTDISRYAIEESFIRPIFRIQAQSDLSFGNGYFDFTYSINVFHNLCYSDLKAAIKEMCRVSKDKKYICVESYRNEEELCALQCWALTCASFYTPDDWKNILSDNGYDGDVEFIYFT